MQSTRSKAAVLWNTARGISFTSNWRLPMQFERRRAPRVEVVGRLHGHIVSVDAPVTVREVSLGGLSFSSTVAFPAGSIHEFRLTMGDDSAVLMRGKIVRSEQRTAED